MKLKLDSKTVPAAAHREGERGVALITMLMLATLLLSAGGALLMTTMMSATTAMDSTAEMQAYYGAEVGLQQAMNALRGNIYKSAATPNIDLRSVVEPSGSNVAGDPATNSNVARMSKWLSYSDTTRYPTQVIVRNAENNEAAITYEVTARDVDGDTKVVTYSTSGVFEANDSGCTLSNNGSTITCNNGVANSFSVTYVPQASTSVTAYPAVASNMGSFTVSRTLTGATIPADKPITFRLTVSQTAPWVSRDTFIASLSGDINATVSALQMDFKGSTVKAGGTQYTLCGACDPLALKHPDTQSPTTALSATITAPQPRRILIQATGYGPKGAVKRIEMVIKKGAFELDAPAPLTVQGASDGTPPTFDTGSSGAKEYSGMDKLGTEGQLPTIAITGTDIGKITAGIPKPETIVSPMLGVLDTSTVPTGTTTTTVSALTPDFLQSASTARDLLNDLQENAESLQRYYKPAAGSVHTVTAANSGATKMTFVDGNCEIEGGSGLVVVTGTLTMSGNPNFNGVILVLGGGQVIRDGGGQGAIYGAMIIAKFDRYGTGGFLAPSFVTNGGGDSKFQYDSFSVTQAMASLTAIPGGVREY